MPMYRVALGIKITNACRIQYLAHKYSNVLAAVVTILLSLYYYLNCKRICTIDLF